MAGLALVSWKYPCQDDTACGKTERILVPYWGVHRAACIDALRGIHRNETATFQTGNLYRLFPNFQPRKQYFQIRRGYETPVDLTKDTQLLLLRV